MGLGVEASNHTGVEGSDETTEQGQNMSESHITHNVKITENMTSITWIRRDSRDSLQLHLGKERMMGFL